jgi:hydrogenase maturation protease
VRYLIGIGNYYGFDDSIGLRIAETIGERGLDRGFQAIDMGGSLLDLLHYIGGDVDGVLIVDSARMGTEPGEFAFFSPDQLVSVKRVDGFSTHEGDLLKVLDLVTALGQPVAATTILGIEPSELREGQGLSETLQARFEEYVAAAVAFFEC